MNIEKCLGLLVSLAVMLIAGCVANPAKNSIADFDNTYTQGARKIDTIVVGGKDVPLYEGEWIIVSSNSSAEYGTGRLMLGLKFEGSLAAITIIDTRVKNIGYSRKIDHPCRYERGTYMMIINDKTGAFECYWVTSTSANTMKNQYTIVNDGFQYLEDKLQTDIPKTYMQTGHFVSKESDYLSVTYLWDSQGVEINRRSPDPSTFLNIIAPYVSRAELWHPKIVQAFRDQN